MSLIFCLLVGPALFSQSLSWMLILFLRAFLREVSRGGRWCLDLLTDFTVLLKISISDFFYHLTFTFSTFFFFSGVSFLIRVFILSSVWLETVHWDFNIYPRFAICIFKIILQFVFLLCCNSKLHQCLFLPLGYRFINHLDLLICSFLLHFHHRIHGFKRASRWWSPKAFAIHLWFSGHFLTWASLGMFLLAQVSLPASLGTMRKEAWNLSQGGKKILGRAQLHFVVRWGQVEASRQNRVALAPPPALASFGTHSCSQLCRPWNVLRSPEALIVCVSSVTNNIFKIPGHWQLHTFLVHVKPTHFSLDYIYFLILSFGSKYI